MLPLGCGSGRIVTQQNFSDSDVDSLEYFSDDEDGQLQIRPCNNICTLRRNFALSAHDIVMRVRRSGSCILTCGFDFYIKGIITIAAVRKSWYFLALCKSRVNITCGFPILSGSLWTGNYFIGLTTLRIPLIADFRVRPVIS